MYQGNGGVAKSMCENFFATENTEITKRKSQILCALCGFIRRE